jgi:hypothetical protein
MVSAFIGFLGVLIGVLINEHFRRRNRIETYSSRIFDKRIQIYEELYSKVTVCSKIITDLIENPKYSREERQGMVSAAVHDLAQFGDDNSFYINEQINIQYMTLLMGVEDIYYISDADKKEQEIHRVWKHMRDTKNMIKKESGIEELDKLFKSITRAEHKSDIIDYYNKLKSKQIKQEME